MAKKKTITSVITGDIVKSRVIKSSRWLTILKKELAREGSSPKTWEIYRGDSFQVEIKDPAEALLRALRIKATIKTIKNLDVRMSIGIGGKAPGVTRITESIGEAFILSGEKLESLKKEKQTLAIRTPWPDFDKEMNLFIRLALIAMDNWSVSSAELVKIVIDNQQITQNKLASRLKISQSSVSERQKRSYYAEIMELENLYREKLQVLTNK
jgi:predicted XRE-type DNA-binding protein